LTSSSTPIRVLLVDDSPVALAVLKRLLATSTDIEVVGTAPNGKEALEMIPRLKPRVICTDYLMPVMDGLEFTRQVMAEYSCPILVISSTVRPDNTDRVFPLLEAGAVDVFPKPGNALDADGHIARQLVKKIKLISQVPVVTRRAKSTPFTRQGSTPAAHTGTFPRPRASASAAVQIVAVGASTGGPQVLQTILGRLPANYPVPILCVQHISAGFLQGLVDWLSSQCALKVEIARPGEAPRAGTIYFPPEGKHLEIDASGLMTASLKPPVDGHRPSVTHTFQSVAQQFGSAAVAVLLTGMGRDGADGMLSIAEAGGVTIAQNEASCVVFGMPRQAIELAAARYVLPPVEIVEKLLDLTLMSK